ncbi:amino acid/amide ABC transporter membrane protein 1, HAAT family [Formivibrio citricus]|uniref:Amino acid/amide ABC transporter membrane protein 1, HAAT family n=1 Tax=Formivibrio citricus TaxID=83765 RepID=A0A1I5CWI8_9NEIS|nr:branched-chain amino acid ABC transporter permease [Formivibrio citricus]SFN90991.1 amino acid/amide ABC transporter membrane protein 1, HAAT family [Formivibrio citricus]
MDFQTFLQQFVNALSLGSLYALIAIGYTMVYGILRLINFAHGDVFMVGGYLAFFGISSFLIPWWLAFALAIVLTTAFGVGLERVAYRPLRDSPRISIMISAIGASFLIENLAIVLFDARPKAFPVAEFFAKNYVIGGVYVAGISLLIPIVTAVLLAVLLWIVNRTKTGMAMRAVSTDIDAARLMAIDVNRIVSITFAIGSALAAIGGIMWALKYPRLEPLMGIMPGLKCFIAAVVGGIGSIAGAVLGGLLLGMVELMTVAFLPELTGYKDAFAFILLIVVLLVKPTGLLGKNQGEKV